MQVIVREPPESLRLFVDKFWYLSADQFDQQDVGLPVLHHELLFNFSEHFSVSQASQTPVVQNEVNWLSGLYTQPQRSTTRGRHETFGVFLKPWALQALTGLPASEMTNQVVTGETVFRQSMTDLSDQFQETSEASIKLTLLERFLLNRFADKDIPAYLIHAAGVLQHRPWQDGMIRNLASELRISPKSLTAAFNKHIGLSPGRFLHLRLLNDALSRLARNPHQSLTELAHDLQFFDQAHLNHLFKTYTDLTPGDYRKLVLTGRVDPAEPCYWSMFSK